MKEREKNFDDMIYNPPASSMSSSTGGSGSGSSSDGSSGSGSGSSSNGSHNSSSENSSWPLGVINFRINKIRSQSGSAFGIDYGVSCANATGIGVIFNHSVVGEKHRNYESSSSLSGKIENLYGGEYTLIATANNAYNSKSEQRRVTISYSEASSDPNISVDCSYCGGTGEYNGAACQYCPAGLTSLAPVYINTDISASASSTGKYYVVINVSCEKAKKLDLIVRGISNSTQIYDPVEDNKITKTVSLSAGKYEITIEAYNGKVRYIKHQLLNVGEENEDIYTKTYKDSHLLFKSDSEEFFMRSVMSDLQRISDDTLKIYTSSGEKYIVIESEANAPVHVVGTKLVRALIRNTNSENVYITYGLASRETDRFRHKASSWTKEIFYTPNDSFTIFTKFIDGSYGHYSTPSYIALAHELIHAYNYVYGLNDPDTNWNCVRYKNDYEYELTGRETTVNKNPELEEDQINRELLAVGIPYRFDDGEIRHENEYYTENAIRKEHGYLARIGYGTIENRVY